MPFLKAVPVSYETEGNITILTFPGSGLIDLPGLPAVHTSVRGPLVHFRLVRGRQRYVLTVFLAGGASRNAEVVYIQMIATAAV